MATDGKSKTSSAVTEPESALVGRNSKRTLHQAHQQLLHFIASENHQQQSGESNCRHGRNNIFGSSRTSVPAPVE
jgi:hypothetical protein